MFDFEPMRYLFRLSLVLALFLTSCGSSATPPPDSQASYETRTGIISAIPLKLGDNYTHELTQANGDKILLRSSYLSLGQYLNQQVDVYGATEPTTSGQLAMDVMEVNQSTTESADLQWDKLSLSPLTIEYPTTWKLTHQKFPVEFSRDDQNPAITISQLSTPLAQLIADQTTDRIRVGNAIGQRIIDETSDKLVTIYVKADQHTYEIKYHTTTNNDQEKAIFYSFLDKLQWRDATTTTSGCGAELNDTEIPMSSGTTDLNDLTELHLPGSDKDKATSGGTTSGGIIPTSN